MTMNARFKDESVVDRIVMIYLFCLSIEIFMIEFLCSSFQKISRVAFRRRRFVRTTARGDISKIRPRALIITNYHNWSIFYCTIIGKMIMIKIFIDQLELLNRLRSMRFARSELTHVNRHRGAKYREQKTIITNCQFGVWSNLCQRNEPA